MSLNVKKGDTVIVIAGQDKGKTGKVLAANPKTGRVTVDGVNIITKHVKARSAQQQSAIEKKNGTIDVSNVQIICPACGKATHVANGEIDGKKNRLCKKCGASLDVKAAKVEKKTTRRTKKATTAEETATEVVAEETPAKKTTAKKSTATKTTTAKKTVAKKTDESSEN